MAHAFLKPVLVGTVAVVVSVVLVVQHNRMQAITREKLAIQTQLESSSAAVAELERRGRKSSELKGDSNLEELLSLRNEVSRLHALEAQWGKAKAEAVQKEANQAQLAKVNAEQEVKAQFEAKIEASTSASKAIAMQLRIMQMRKNLKGAFDQDGRLAPDLISKSHPDFDVRKVEFLYPDAAQLARITEEAPETIIARTEAMAAPDGTWSRVYTLADGSVHQKSTSAANQVYEGKWQLTEVK